MAPRTILMSREQLRFLLLDRLRDYSEASLFVSGENPYKFEFNGKTFWTFVGNIHSAGRLDPDESRIQVPGQVLNRFKRLAARGMSTCVLGYHAESDVISAWDPRRFVKRGGDPTRFSLYSRFSVHRRARRHGASIYETDLRERVASFQSQYLGLYAENVERFHDISERGLLKTLDKYGAVGVSTGGKSQEITVERKKFKVTHTRYQRDPAFRNQVLRAYGGKCAICGIQLGLVEAAHIVPHAHPRSSDNVGNGVSLCALHHKAYDTGLIYFDIDYRTRINSERAGYLKKTGQDGGINWFRGQRKKFISLPTAISNRPKRENIRLGNRIRLTQP